MDSAMPWKSGPFRAALGFGYAEGFQPLWSPFIMSSVKIHRG